MEVGKLWKFIFHGVWRCSRAWSGLSDAKRGLLMPYILIIYV